MISSIATLWHRLLPPAPAVIREELLHLQFERLRNQIPLLYVVTIITVLTAMIATNGEADPLLRLGVPLAMLGLFGARLAVWIRLQSHQISRARKIRLLRNCHYIVAIVGLLASSWALKGWATITTGAGSHMPVFLAVGTFSSAYCIAVLPAAALLVLALSMAPVVITFFLTGTTLEMGIAGNLAVATLFLGRMILQQHKQTVDMLVLRNTMREQADTDPLTGLLNRRALHEQLMIELNAASPEFGPAVALLDLDGFKPINDRYGHAAGDSVLKTVASRLQDACGMDAFVARLGGDEFALLVRRDSNRTPSEVCDRAILSLVPAYNVGSVHIRVGASFGLATWPRDGATPDDLMAAADRALYVAKAEMIAAARARKVLAKSIILAA